MKLPNFLSICVLFFLPLCSAFSANEIKVVRPQPGEELTISEGYTYVIGTLPSDQYTLRCNSKLCDVYSDGAFIGYIPLKRLASPQTVNQKTMDVVFEFNAVKGKEKLTKTVYCMTPSSPSSKKIATEKFPEPKLMEALSDQWVALENTLLPDDTMVFNLGKLVFFPKGCQFFVTEKKGNQLLYADPPENIHIQINDYDVKPVTGNPPATSVHQSFTSERTPQSTLYRFQTPVPTPFICEETMDRQTVRLRFLTPLLQTFILPQPRRIWGFDATYDNGQTLVTVKYAPAINPKKPFEGLKILIDPGHNPDSGVLGPRGTEEKTMALLLSKQLFEVLKSRGSEPILTQEGKPLTPQERLTKYKAVNPDLMISIHFSAVADNEDPKIKWGTRTVYLLPHSLPMAKAIQRSLMAVMQGHDLSFIQLNLPATSLPSTPLALVESNMIMPDEEERLLTKEYRDQTANAIANGISNFLLGERPSAR